jgi:hypothetical protein
MAGIYPEDSPTLLTRRESGFIYHNVHEHPCGTIGERFVR